MPDGGDEVPGGFGGGGSVLGAGLFSGEDLLSTSVCPPMPAMCRTLISRTPVFSPRVLPAGVRGVFGVLPGIAVGSVKMAGEYHELTVRRLE